MLNKCTPMWREAHIQVKICRAHQDRTTFGSWDDEKCVPLLREAHFQVKMYKTHQHRSTFRSYDVEKVHAVVAQAHFEVKSVKVWRVWNTFGRSDVVLRGRRTGFCTLSKVSKVWGFCGISKTMAAKGRLKRIWQDAFSVAGAIQETCSSEMLGGPGADFLRGVAFWSIRFSVLGRWFCVTGAALRMTWHHFFVAGAVLYRQVEWKIGKRLVRGRQLCTQLSIFERSLAELFRFWLCQLRKLRKSRKLFRFWCCEFQKLRKSRRIEPFSNLQIDR